MSPLKIDPKTGKYTKVKPPKQSYFYFKDESGKRHRVKTWKELPKAEQERRGFRLTDEQRRHNISVGVKNFWKSEEGQKLAQKYSQRAKAQGGVGRKKQQRERPGDYFGGDGLGVGVAPDMIDGIIDTLKEFPDVRRYRHGERIYAREYVPDIIAKINEKIRELGRKEYNALLLERADDIEDCLRVITYERSEKTYAVMKFKQLMNLISLREMDFDANVEATMSQKDSEFLELDADYDPDDPYYYL